MYVCVYMGVHKPWHAAVTGQLVGMYALLRVPGVALGLPGLVAGAFTRWAIFLVLIGNLDELLCFLIGHSHQLFHVCVILATHLQMEAILLDKTLRKEWLLATSRPFSLPQIAAALLLCIIFCLSNIIYFSAALYRTPEPELHEKETWFQNMPGFSVKSLGWCRLKVAKRICSDWCLDIFKWVYIKKKKYLTWGEFSTHALIL